MDGTKLGGVFLIIMVFIVGVGIGYQSEIIFSYIKSSDSDKPQEEKVCETDLFSVSVPKFWRCVNNENGVVLTRGKKNISFSSLPREGLSISRWWDRNKRDKFGDPDIVYGAVWGKEECGKKECHLSIFWPDKSYVFSARLTSGNKWDHQESSSALKEYWEIISSFKVKQNK